MIFTIPPASEGFTALTTVIITTIPGSAICTIIPTTHSTGEQAYTLAHRGEVLGTMITTTPPITAAVTIMVTTLLIHMDGATIITAPTIPDTTTDITTAIGEAPIITITAATAIMAIALPAPRHTVPMQAMQEHPQENRPHPLTPVTTGLPEQVRMAPAEHIPTTAGLPQLQHDLQVKG